MCAVQTSDIIEIVSNCTQLGSLSEKTTGFFGSFTHTGEGGVSQNPKKFVI